MFNSKSNEKIILTQIDCKIGPGTAKTKQYMWHTDAQIEKYKKTHNGCTTDSTTDRSADKLHLKKQTQLIKVKHDIAKMKP